MKRIIQYLRKKWEVRKMREAILEIRQGFAFLGLPVWDLSDEELAEMLKDGSKLVAEHMGITTQEVAELLALLRGPEC